MIRSQFYPHDCWRISLQFHPFVWRLRFVGAAKAGREWCQQTGASYRWFSVGPFTISEGYLQ
jgi:hypothetical protein